MYNKIKSIRNFLELSETQVSSLLNMSSYKYKALENCSMEINTETLLLLSILYNIPIDHLFSDNYSVNSILELPTILAVANEEKHRRVQLLKNNIFSIHMDNSERINHKLIKKILDSHLSVFSKNIKKLRLEKECDIRELCLLLKVSEYNYFLYEQGKKFPKLMHLLILSNYYNLKIDELFN